MFVQANNSLVSFFKKNDLINDLQFEELYNCNHEALSVSGLCSRYKLAPDKVKEAIFGGLGCNCLSLKQEVSLYNTLSLSTLIKKIGFDVCRDHLVFPLPGKSDTVRLVLANPFDLEIRDTAKFLFAAKVEFFLADENEINRALANLSPQLSMTDDALSEELGPQIEVLGCYREQEYSIEESNDADLSVVIKLSNKILADALNQCASDVHLEPRENDLLVRFRIDGILRDVRTIPKSAKNRVIARYKMLASMDLAEHRRPQDGRIRILYNNNAIDIRASAVPTSHGETIVLRLLALRWDELSLSNFGMPKKVEAELSEVLESNSGLILITGPTGSGKTTMLYACLMRLKDGTTNIVTVEDPVEYRLPGLNQIQVNEQIGVTFPKALRSVLRQDPDIILIGEIRDQETAKIAVQAAQTGHLVLATLHTNDAIGAITRLVDLGVDPLSLTEVLRGVLAQRLVRKVCECCSGSLSHSKIEIYKKDALISHWNFPLEELKEGFGCDECNSTGYLGRQGIYSFLKFTPALARLTLEGVDTESLRSSAIKSGHYNTLAEAASYVLKAGKTSISEVKSLLQEALPSSVSVPEHRNTPKNISSLDTVIIEAEEKPVLASLPVLLIDENSNRRMHLKKSLLSQNFLIMDTDTLPLTFDVYEEVETIVCTGEILLDSSSLEFIEESKKRKLKIIALATQNLSKTEVRELEDMGFGIISTSSSAVALGSAIHKLRGA